MAFLPSSPRRRRRLAALGTVLVAAAAVAVAALLLGGPAGQESTPVRAARSATVSSGPPLRMTPARRREIDTLVRRFTTAAVTRHDPAGAWALASEGMRRGTTRSGWTRGEIPGVLPFPDADVSRTSWRLVYRTPERIGIDVLVQPLPGLSTRPLVYQVDLVPEAGRLRVDAWAPEASLAAGAPGRPATEKTTAAAAAPRTSGRLSAAWLLVPAALFALAVLAVVGLAVRNARRNRRAYRAYHEHAGL